MEITTVAILGGSGFVGRHLCQVLAAEGYRVRVATRDRERAKKDLILLPTVDVAYANVHDPAELSAFVHGADAVVNLVGVLHEGKANASFEQAHIELARKVVAACRGGGIRRLLHMSALNADPGGPSVYLRTKGEAERIVRESGLACTIFRPSVMFGRGDRFLNLFAQLLRVFPLMALGKPAARFQPVYVGDVAAAFERALGDVETFDKSYELCGPRVYTLRELVEYVGTVTGHRRPVIGLSDTLSYWQAAVMELSPWKLLTRDNVRSMEVDSVCKGQFPFGMVPKPLEAVVPLYLERRTPRARYQGMRERARRQAERQDN